MMVLLGQLVEISEVQVEMDHLLQDVLALAVKAQQEHQGNLMVEIMEQ
jgi:hypothetical protein